MWTLAAFPFCYIPFLYVTSFLFSNESAGQTFTLFFTFFQPFVLSGSVMIIRMNEKLWYAADVLHWMLRALPSYNIGSSIFFEANGNGVAHFRKTGNFGRQIDLDPMYIENNLADIIYLLVFGVVWCLVLVIIENGL